MGRGVYRSYYKGHKDKIKGENRGGEGGGKSKFLKKILEEFVEPFDVGINKTQLYSQKKKETLGRTWEMLLKRRIDQRI